MNISLDQFRGFDKRIYILGLGWLITAAGFAMVIPFISLYFYQEMNMTMTAIGMFFGFTAILRAIPQPFAGWLSDKIGRVPIMGWSQVLRSFTFVGVAIAMLYDLGFIVIAAIISLNYIFGSVLHPTANAMVADLVEKEKRLSAYAFLRISGNLGWAIGPAMGGFIAHVSYPALFFISGIMAFISGLFFLFALKDVEKTHEPENDLKPKEPAFNIKVYLPLLKYCVISFVLFLAVAQFIATLSVYSTEVVGISKTQLGWLYAINGLMVVVLQFFISSLFRKLKLTNQLAIGAVIYSFGYLLMVFAGQFWFLILFMVIITVAEMIVSPPSVTLVANLSPKGQYGKYMGVFGMFQMAGWSLGPTLGGILMDLFSYNTSHMWYVISLMALVTVFLFLNYGRNISSDVNSASKLGVSGGKNS
ncbi:MAG: MFS transporter [candidate division Zixibacteria bacterium]|nr:MFS transporter [candidate division Zixibacteria bacterium]